MLRQALEADPDNHLLWHARRRRLEGEAVRDAMLAVSGELNSRMFGVSARPKLPDRISSYAWKPDAKPEDQDRRSVYVFAKRNLRYPLFDAFDLPDMHNSCARRAVTTTAPQALLLLNGDFALERARRLGADLAKQFPTDDAGLAARAYRLAWGRPATDDEVRLAVKFLAAQTARPALARRRRRRLLPCPAEHERVFVRGLIQISPQRTRRAQRRREMHEISKVPLEHVFVFLCVQRSPR